MYKDSGETTVAKIITFRNDVPHGNSGMPCGACREALLEFNTENMNTEIMTEFATRQTVLLSELMPKWWGTE